MTNVKVEFAEEEIKIIKKYVIIDDKKYDLEDIVDDINAIGDNIAFMPDDIHTKLFLDLKILSHPGSFRNCFPAKAGENLEHYRKLFTEKYYGD